MHEPYRGRFGAPRPRRLAGVPLPPAPMPPRQGGRPLKAWRYVAVFAEELMLCAASLRIGPLRQCFWAVWDREAQRLEERTRLGAGAVRLTPGGLEIPSLSLRAELAEEAGIEAVCPAGTSYAWTRKQGGIPARVERGGRSIAGRAIVDDTAAYYPRHTEWYWAAGVGTTTDGRLAAWNLVAGVNDPPTDSERTVWIDGVPAEPPPQAFAPDLSRVGELRFAAEAERRRDENRLVVRSRYRQPFGTVVGRLPGGATLTRGFGVMEHHDVTW